ncbi:MAG: glycosyltransferase family 39 protein [Acidobacteria bacterium]|nr:glycosyltransferase family 39 protein [Acidobacteriota bacterium]
MKAARALGLLATTAAIAAATLAPRLVALDRALTIDEKLWLERSARFAAAVSDARFADAIETGHPGVTTMWIAGFAQRTLPPGAPLRQRYARARLGLAVAGTLLILAIWGLARAVIGTGAAMLGALLLALDPFLLAHGRVVHLDGLLALLMAASFLALLRGAGGSRRFVALSGALAGLAALTKQPAIFLMIAAVVVLKRSGRGLARPLAVWLGAAAAVAFAAWPVLWVRPWHAIALMAGGGGAAVADSHSGGFFLGRRVGNPGALFYPVVFAWRSSILTLPAAAATIVWAIRRRERDAGARRAVAFLSFALGFAALMTIGAKKGDRYILPSFVAVDLAVAVALARALGAVRPSRRAVPAIALALALHGGPALALIPWPLAHFNWLAGGPVSARGVMVVGWGEGLDAAAERLNALPGAERLTVATTRVTQFEDFFRGRTVRLGAPGSTPDYVLFYVSSVQTGRFEAEWRRYERRRPFWTLTINRIPYVRVYRAIGR